MCKFRLSTWIRTLRVERDPMAKVRIASHASSAVKIDSIVGTTLMLTAGGTPSLGPVGVSNLSQHLYLLLNKKNSAGDDAS